MYWCFNKRGCAYKTERVDSSATMIRSDVPRYSSVSSLPAANTMGVSGGSLFCAHHVCTKFIRTHTRASPRSRTRRRVSAMMERVRKLSSLSIAESNQKVSLSSGTLFCAYHVMSRIKSRPFACAGPLCKSPGSRRATQPEAHTQAQSFASRVVVVLSECTRLVRLLEALLLDDECSD